MKDFNMHHSSNEYSLFVGDLPHDCGDDKLRGIFQQKFKSVKRVQSKLITPLFSDSPSSRVPLTTIYL